MAIVVYAFVTTWNEFIFALCFAQDSRVKTLPIGIAEFTTEFNTDWGAVMAASLIMTLPDRAAVLRHAAAVHRRPDGRGHQGVKSHGRPIATTSPRLGLGTYGRTGAEGLTAILDALEIGYRHIDTAQTYDTEANVGEALRRSGLPRSDVFITTKVAEQGSRGRTFSEPPREPRTLGVNMVDLA